MKQILFFLITICCIHNGLSQNFGNRQRGQRDFSPPQNIPTGDAVSPDVNVLSQERADMYQEILQIDDFQKEVLKSFLKDYYTKTSAITFNNDLKFDDKQKGINTEKKRLERSLLDVFRKDQVEIIITEEQFGSKTKEYKKEKRKEKKRRKRKEKGND